MTDIITEIFGVYTIPEGMTCNVEYFVGVGLFALMLYCVMRIIGSVIIALCGGRR